MCSISTFAALCLDIYVFRQATRLGKFSKLGGADMKHPEPVYQDAGMAGYTAQEMPTRPKGTGYGVPEEQFTYDTTYRGSATLQ